MFSLHRNFVSHRRDDVGIHDLTEAVIRPARNADLHSLVLLSHGRLKTETIVERIDEALDIVLDKPLRIEQHAFGLFRLDRSVVHEPVRDTAFGQEVMDQPGDTFTAVLHELVSIKPECLMAHRLKPHVVMRGISLSLGRSEDPLFEQAAQMFGIGQLLPGIFELDAVRSAAVLCFEMRISEKGSDEDFTLDVGKLQRGFAFFDCLGVHRVVGGRESRRGDETSYRYEDQTISLPSRVRGMESGV